MQNKLVAFTSIFFRVRHVYLSHSRSMIHRPEDGLSQDVRLEHILYSSFYELVWAGASTTSLLNVVFIYA